MKSIILITTLFAILINGGTILIYDSEPVALIFLGVCFIGMAKIGRTQIKNNIDRYNWRTLKLMFGNSLLKRPITKTEFLK